MAALLLGFIRNLTRPSNFKILTGRVPFYNYTNDIWITVAISQGRTPARKDYPELPEDNKFWEVLEGCWRADPSERPSMAQLAPAICKRSQHDGNVHFQPHLLLTKYSVLQSTT